MRTIKAMLISHEAFAEFGTFYDMMNPSGYALEGAIHKFYPDRMSEATVSRVAYSPLVVKKTEKRIIDAVEYHNTTPEMILPMNDDMIIHVAPASNGTPVPDCTKAFIVPKGTLVKINTAIWHLAPLPVNEESLTAIIILPETTYARDCIVVELKEDEQFEIVL